LAQISGGNLAAKAVSGEKVGGVQQLRFNRQILRTRNCPGDARRHPVKKCVTHWLASFRPEFLRGLIHTGNGFNSGGSLRLQAVDGFGVAVFRQLRNSR
jgi:hypothetical protein